MKILFLVPYPLGESPSQRFRFEQYFNLLAHHQIQYKVSSFLKSHDWKTFFKSGRSWRKAGLLIEGMLRRMMDLFQAANSDFVFIHRECAPIGPPVFEWIIAKVLRKKIIYDFDDAIWMTDKTNESWMERKVRWRSKVKWICTWSYKVSCGNNYLGEYARQFNKNVVLNPTTIDTADLHNNALHVKVKNEKIIIGWTGSHSTLKYLKSLEHVLQKLEAKYSAIEFWVIADRSPSLKLAKLHFKAWSLETEISDLAHFDIGIMPLPDDEWTKGKCGFKALQYMALEIPTVASAIGVNTSIIQHGINGLLVTEASQWESFLINLIENESLRKQLGAEGRKTVEKSYSVQSNKGVFLSLFAD